MSKEHQKHFKIVESDGLWFYLNPHDVVEIEYRAIIAGKEASGTRKSTAWLCEVGQNVIIGQDTSDIAWSCSGRVIF